MAGRFVTVEEVVAEASSIMKGVTSAERQMMRQWVWTSQRLIGWSKADIKVSENLILSDHATAKPSDLIRTIDLGLFLSNGTEMLVKYKAGGHRSTGDENLRIHSDGRSVVRRVIVTEDANFFYTDVFTEPSPTDSYLVVRYYGLPLDSNLLPLIPEHCKFALMMFIRWMWSMRNNDSRTVQAMAEQQWLRHRRIAEGKSKTPDLLEAEAIARTANSMIQSFGKLDRRF